MDPNEALAKIREAVKAERDRVSTDIGGWDDPVQYQDMSDLTDHFEALDEWLTKGGFLPDDWKKDDTAT